MQQYRCWNKVTVWLSQVVCYNIHALLLRMSNDVEENPIRRVYDINEQLVQVLAKGVM